MIKLINFNVVTKFHYGYDKVCKYICVTIRTCVTNIMFQRKIFLEHNICHTCPNCDTKISTDFDIPKMKFCDNIKIN